MSASQDYLHVDLKICTRRRSLPDVDYVLAKADGRALRPVSNELKVSFTIAHSTDPR